MIVLEGPDRAGKSTLAEIIAKRFNSPIRHLPGSEVFNDKVLRHWDRVLEEINDYGQVRNRNIIYDRMVLGSLVYAFKADRHNIQPVTALEYGQWLCWMAMTESLLICAEPPLKTILERCKETEKYVTLDEMVTVHRAYHDIFWTYMDSPPPFPVLFYDSSVMTADQFLRNHEQMIKKALL